MLRLIQFSVLLFNHPKYINLHRLAELFLDDHPDGGYLSVPYQKLLQLPLSVRILVGLVDGEPAYSDPASAAGAGHCSRRGSDGGNCFNPANEGYNWTSMVKPTIDHT